MRACRNKGRPRAAFAVRMEEKVINLIEHRGPLTGAEIRDALSNYSFAQWKACMLSSTLVVRKLGMRYLRLDHQVEGFARLSPSILREFLTYSVVGLTCDTAALDRRAQEIISHIRAVSRCKLDLARAIITGIASGLADGGEPEGRFCVIIAGDIVYEMAHDVPRPERSTGRMVNGSDLDMIVILDDHAPEALMKQLDDAIYKEKYRHLINPSVREEIDYIIKRLERLREQATFDTFKKMVACKILQEGMLLYGSRALFNAAKDLLSEYKVTQKLDAMEKSAAQSRQRAEQYLLGTHQSVLAGDDLYLFYTADESEEFE